MRLSEAMAAAREWVTEHGGALRGFVGAYIAGSANWMEDGDELPASSDLDVHVVLEDPGDALKPGKLIYGGVLLEVSYIPREAVRSAEVVLGNYHAAGSFRRNSVIADPSGALTAIQEVVAREYAQREWVRKRCEHAADSVRRMAGALKEAVPLHDQATICAFSAGVLTHVLLVAGLKNPTVRKRYAAVRELLAEYDRLDFHEELLARLGCAEMNRGRVEGHLAAVTEVYDAAKGVLRTPYRFGSDISEVARPISIDGSRELIERGLHREAVFWLVATYSRSRHILAADAPELLERFDPPLMALLEDLGTASFRAREARCREVVAFLPRVWEVAEEIMAASPDIKN